MRFLLVASILTLCECAKRPENIAAADIGPNLYTGYSCSQLAAEELQLTQEFANLSADQNRAANGDAFGVFLLELPVSSMTGADQDTNIAIARGRLQAIDETQLSRRC